VNPSSSYSLVLRCSAAPLPRESEGPIERGCQRREGIGAASLEEAGRGGARGASFRATGVEQCPGAAQWGRARAWWVFSRTFFSGVARFHREVGFDKETVHSSDDRFKHMLLAE
jgi:hypothetical protein